MERRAPNQPPKPIPPQPPEPNISKFERARNIAQHLIDAIGRLPESYDRTNAHGRAEEALGYTQKMYEDELEQDRLKSQQ